MMDICSWTGVFNQVGDKLRKVAHQEQDPVAPHCKTHEIQGVEMAVDNTNYCSCAAGFQGNDILYSGCMCRGQWWLLCPCHVQEYCTRTENVFATQIMKAMEKCVFLKLSIHAWLVTTENAI